MSETRCCSCDFPVEDEALTGDLCRDCWDDEGLLIRSEPLDRETAEMVTKMAGGREP
jgi:hypothetical protein